MKRPELENNNYYPFYTRSDTGKKKSFYKTQTIMHLSESRAILISRKYNNSKINELSIEMTSNMQYLRELRKESKHISFSDFATEVQTVYGFLSRAVKKLAKTTPYKIDYYETVYFKNGRSIFFEFDKERFNLLFGDGFNQATGSQEIEQALFDKQLNESWASFIEYFKCPKYINKTAYKPNFK